MNFLDRKSRRYTGGKRRRVSSLTQYQDYQEDRLVSIMARTVVSMINGNSSQLSVCLYRDPVPEANLGKPGVGSLISIDPNTLIVSPVGTVDDIKIYSTQNSKQP